MRKIIEDAAVKYADDKVFPETALRGFIDGAFFSLSHQWRSVDDELPADDETVLTLSSCGHVLAYYSKQDEMWFAYGDYGDITPTHWLTIPSLNPEQRWESY